MKLNICNLVYIVLSTYLLNGCIDSQEEAVTNNYLIDFVDSSEFETYFDDVPDSKGEVGLVRFEKLQESILRSKFQGVFPEPEIILSGDKEIGIFIVREKKRLVILKKDELLPSAFAVNETIVEKRIYAVERGIYH